MDEAPLVSRPVTTSAPSGPAAIAKVTIVVPAYNEARTIGDVLRRLAAIEFPVAKEVLVVDDGSRDDTLAIARAIAAGHADMRVLTKPNGGKGSALRHGFAHASGDVVVVQDADLEIDPAECVPLLAPFLRDGAVDVVYGSRFLGKPIQWTSGHLANRVLSWLTSVLFGARVTDMETSHKMIRTTVLAGVALTANRFDIEPEITGKLMRLGCRIHEVAIGYQPRSVAEGKKIGWRDGVDAVTMLWRVRLMPLSQVRSAAPAVALDADATPSNVPLR